MPFAVVASLFCLLVASVAAAPRHDTSNTPSEDAIFAQRAASPYAPSTDPCPSTPLVRRANGISDAEAAYVKVRKVNADKALVAYLEKINQGFNTTGAKLPTIALATSGGGLRSMLSGAGVIQALDGRDGDDNVAGIYQALTYESGLSGGGWLLSSMSGNNWPTITQLKTQVYEKTLSTSILEPKVLLASPEYASITNDVVAKDYAGYRTTMTDPYGRLLGYLFYQGDDGGVGDTLSGLTSSSNFTSHAVPYPIIAAIGVPFEQQGCTPMRNGTQYELSPYEFGSWDSGVDAFTQTKYLGTELSNGHPASAEKCTVGFDNLGFVAGTTSNVFNELCIVVPFQDPSANSFSVLESIVNKSHPVSSADDYAQYPNPFRDYAASERVAADRMLRLVDGGESEQNNPVWPFLHRDIDVLFVNDNSGDLPGNYPNGSELYNTYIQAKNDGLISMPIIPTADVFVSKGLNRKPAFFGCTDASKITVIYIPNAEYTFNSGQSTFKFQYSKAETDAMIANGRLVGSLNNNETWGECVGCVIMKKSNATLPKECSDCFYSFCFN